MKLLVARGYASKRRPRKESHILKMRSHLIHLTAIWKLVNPNRVNPRGRICSAPISAQASAAMAAPVAVAPAITSKNNFAPFGAESQLLRSNHSACSSAAASLARPQTGPRCVYKTGGLREFAITRQDEFRLGCSVRSCRGRASRNGWAEASSIAATSPASYIDIWTGFSGPYVGIWRGGRVVGWGASECSVPAAAAVARSIAAAWRSLVATRTTTAAAARTQQEPQQQRTPDYPWVTWFIARGCLRRILSTPVH